MEKPFGEAGRNQTKNSAGLTRRGTGYAPALSALLSDGALLTT